MFLNPDVWAYILKIRRSGNAGEEFYRVKVSWTWVEGWVPEPVKGFCSQTLSDSTDRIRTSGGYAHPFGFSQLLGEGREHWLLQARGGWIQRGSFLGPSRAETDCRLHPLVVRPELLPLGQRSPCHGEDIGTKGGQLGRRVGGQRIWFCVD